MSPPAGVALYLGAFLITAGVLYFVQVAAWGLFRQIVRAARPTNGLEQQLDRCVYCGEPFGDDVAGRIHPWTCERRP